MTECAHCHGTGNEPDPVFTAYAATLKAVEDLAALMENDPPYRSNPGHVAAARSALDAYRSAEVARWRDYQDVLIALMRQVDLPVPRAGTGFVSKVTFRGAYADWDRWLEMAEDGR